MGTRNHVTDDDISRELDRHGLQRFGIHEKWLNSNRGRLLRELVRVRLAGEETTLSSAARRIEIPPSTARVWRSRYKAFREASDGALGKWELVPVPTVDALEPPPPSPGALQIMAEDWSYAQDFPPEVGGFISGQWGVPDDPEDDAEWWSEFESLRIDGRVSNTTDWFRDALGAVVVAWLSMASGRSWLDAQRAWMMDGFTDEERADPARVMLQEWRQSPRFRAEERAAVREGAALMSGTKSQDRP